MSTRGLDVSEFQGTVDWEQVKAAGYQFATFALHPVLRSSPYGNG